MAHSLWVFVRVFRVACTLETFITAFWMTFSIWVFEDSGWVDRFQSEQNTFLFSCITTFSYFIFVNLAWSVLITWHFSPCPKRVASTELLVFMYVNRFLKLHSKIFSACNYSAFFFFSFFCVFNELTFVCLNTVVRLISFQISYFRLQD